MDLTSDMPKWKSKYCSHNLTAGTSIYLSNGGMLGGQLSYSKSTDKYGGRSESEMLKNNAKFENLTSDIFSHSNYHQWISNVYYESKLSKHLGVNFNADYLHRKASDGRTNAEEGNLTSAHSVNNDNQMTHNIYSGLLSFKYNVKDNLSFTLGSNVSHVSDDKTNDEFDNNNETNKFALQSKENKYAVFFECDFSINKLSAQAGIRYEIFKMLYKNEIAHQTIEDRSYHRWYPFMSLSLPVKAVKMAFSFSTKVSRPSYYQLRNSKEYFNRYEIEAGNPLLLPQYTTDLSYSLQYKSFRVGLDYQWIKDYLMTNNIILEQSPLVAMSQPFNKSHYSAFSVNASYNKTIGIWESYLSTSIMRTFLDIYDNNGNRMNGHIPYFRASMDNYFNLKHQWMPYLLLGYNNTGDMREYRIKDAFYLDFGVTKRLFHNNLFMRLSVSNALGTKEKKIRYAPDYVFYKDRFKDVYKRKEESHFRNSSLL
jgi:hypothetical protein